MRENTHSTAPLLRGTVSNDRANFAISWKQLLPLTLVKANSSIQNETASLLFELFHCGRHNDLYQVSRSPTSLLYNLRSSRSWRGGFNWLNIRSGDNDFPTVQYWQGACPVLISLPRKWNSGILILHSFPVQCLVRTQSTQCWIALRNPVDCTVLQVDFQKPFSYFTGNTEGV